MINTLSETRILDLHPKESFAKQKVLLTFSYESPPPPPRSFDPDLQII